MPNLPFTLRQLEVFASLCTTRSFRRSADSLAISQASVSNQIKALEQQLGVALFARRPGQRPVPTSEGMAFLEDYRTFAAAAEALARHRRAGEAGDQPVHYRVLIGQGLLDGFVRAKLDRFFTDNPRIELAFEAQPPGGTAGRGIQDGRYDFALIHRRDSLAVEPYWRQLALIRGGIYGHRKFLDGNAPPLSAEVIAGLPFIMPLAASTQEREVLKLLHECGIRPRRVIGHTQYYDVMAAMLERGVGVASFSDAVLPLEMRGEVVVLHPLENWRLLGFRKNPAADPQRDAVEAFLLSSVLQDPNYLTIEVTAGEMTAA
ncbi:MAG: LysR family transcriptional regulator [Croceibacterium sp.]